MDFKAAINNINETKLFNILGHLTKLNIINDNPSCANANDNIPTIPTVLIKLLISMSSNIFFA